MTNDERRRRVERVNECGGGLWGKRLYLKIPRVDAPKETPGRGKGFAYIIRYDVSKARKVLGVEFRDKTTTTKDTIEDFKAWGWLN